MKKILYKSSMSLLIRCSLLAIMMIISLYIPQVNIVALIFAIYCIFSMNDEDTLCLFFFMVCFAPIFKIQLGGFSLLNLLILTALGKKLFRYKGKIKGRATKLLIFLVAYTFISCFLYNPSDWLTFIAYIVFVFYWYKPLENKLSFHKIVRFFVLGIITTSILALCADYFPRLQSIMSETTIRFSAGVYYYRFSGLDPNPNYYTISLSVCIAAIAVMIHTKKAKIIDYIFLVCLTVFGLMTVSQSFLVCYIITWLLFIIFGGVRRIKKVFPAILLLIVVFIIAIMLIDEATLQTLLFRFNTISDSESISSATSGRSELWTVYLSYLINNPIYLLLGKGIGAPNLPSGASHNYYIDIVYHLGIIGGMIYISFLVSVFGRRKYFGKTELFRYIPYFAFFIRAIARNLILSEQLFFLLMVCSLAVYDGYNNKIG